MDHAALEELWLDFTEGTLPALEARAVRAHLEACTTCAARYERLAAAHAASVQAGRAAREDGRSSPIPGAVRDRVLAAARAAAAGPAPRRRVWMLSGVAALAVAAAAILLVRVEVARERDEGFVSRTLALAEPPAGARGADDELSVAAHAAAERWRRGELRIRGFTRACPGGDLHVAGLVDATGAPVLVAAGERDHVDVYVFREDGREAGSLRAIGGIRSEFLLPPRTRAEARALLDAAGCPPATDR